MESILWMVQITLRERSPGVDLSSSPAKQPIQVILWWDLQVPSILALRASTSLETEKREGKEGRIKIGIRKSYLAIQFARNSLHES